MWGTNLPIFLIFVNIEIKTVNMKRTLTVLLFILLSVFSLRADKFRLPAEKKNPDAVRVLLIGNSFTYYHDADDMLVEIASSQGVNIDLGEFLKGGQTFGQHLKLANSRKAINAGDYDFAFLQDQSVTPAKYARDKYQQALDDLIALKRLVVMRSPDCKVILERTWGYDGKEAGGFGTREILDKYLEKGTKDMAKKAKTWRSPIGIAFNTVVAERPEIALLGDDDKHQSAAGSYLKACVNYLVITGEDFDDYVPNCGLDPEHAEYLRDVAERTVLGHEGKYRIKREKKYNPFGPKTRVVAHRGYHLDPSCPENSIAALKASSKAGVFGSEFDIRLTRDNKIVVCHDKSYKTDTLGRVISDTDYELLSELRLSNGEPVPTFESFLDSAKALRPLKLVCELKDLGDKDKNEKLFDEAYKLVTSKKMGNRMIWQTFNYPLCLYIRSKAPEAFVVYLCTKEDKIKTAAGLAQDKISGVNYKYTLYKKHPSLIEELHDNNISAGLCAEDDSEIISDMVDEGINIVGTNNPNAVLKLIKDQRR